MHMIHYIMIILFLKKLTKLDKNRCNHDIIIDKKVQYEILW
jgi:hypothetical protein